MIRASDLKTGSCCVVLEDGGCSVDISSLERRAKNTVRCYGALTKRNYYTVAEWLHWQ